MRLTTREAAEVIADPNARRYLEPFIGMERSVSEVAHDLDVAMSSVLYRVRRFIDLGLLEVTRTQQRPGRAIKFYQAVADGIFVPFNLTDIVNIEDISPQITRGARETFRRNLGHAWKAAGDTEGTWGIVIYRNSEGIVESDVVPEANMGDPSSFFRGLLEPNAPAVWDSWSTYRLKFDTAKALQREMRSLLERYQEQDEEENGEAYIVRLAMTPVEES